jgi:hypothetical protein
MDSASLPQPRPLLLGPRVTDWLVAHGVAQGQLDVPALLRQHRERVTAAYEAALRGGCDVVFTATEGTTPYALAASGHAFRAAALTALAVEVAIEASARATYAVAIAGIVGAGEPPRDAIFAFEEHLAHAERLALAGVHILVAEATTLEGLREVVRASLPTRLPVWARIPLDEDGRGFGQSVDDLGGILEREGATSLVLTAPSVRAASLAMSVPSRLSRTVRLTQTLDFAGDSAALLALGVRGIGGPPELEADDLRQVCESLRPRRPSEPPPSRSAAHSLPPGLLPKYGD